MKKSGLRSTSHVRKSTEDKLKAKEEVSSLEEVSKTATSERKKNDLTFYRVRKLTSDLINEFEVQKNLSRLYNTLTSW